MQMHKLVSEHLLGWRRVPRHVSACCSEPEAISLKLPASVNTCGLARREYKPIMKAAYFNSTDPQFRAKFSLELTKAESVGLCQAFDRKARAGGSSKRPQPLPGSAAASSSTQRCAPVRSRSGQGSRALSWLS